MSSDGSEEKINVEYRKSRPETEPASGAFIWTLNRFVTPNFKRFWDASSKIQYLVSTPVCLGDQVLRRIRWRREGVEVPTENKLTSARSGCRFINFSVRVAQRAKNGGSWFNLLKILFKSKA